jgi:hypothetical protein
VADILDLAADTLAPRPPAHRARIRALLYQVIDTAPAGSDADPVEQLKNDAFIPNAEAATALALELGAMIRDHFVRLVTRILELLAEAILLALEEFLAAVEQQVAAWIAELQHLVDQIAQTIQAVLHEIAVLRDQVEAAAAQLLDRAEHFLGLLAGTSQRGKLKDAVRDIARDACIGALNDIPGYSLLPSGGRRLVRDTLDDVLGNLLNQPMFGPLFEAVGAIAGDIDDFLQDARNIDPADDVAGALVELLVDRLEDAIRDAFGASVHLDVAFHVHGTYRGPRIDTPLGSYRPEVTLDFDFDLGSVRVDIDDLVRALRAAARALQAVTSGAHDLAATLAHVIGLEQQLDARELERDDMNAQSSDATRKVTETRELECSIRILEPGAAGAYSGDIPVRIALMGVPASFLGPDDEAPRIFVFLNHAPIDIGRLDVVEALEGLPGLGRPGLPAGLAEALPATPRRAIPATPLGSMPATPGRGATLWFATTAPGGALQRLIAPSRQAHPVAARGARVRVQSRATDWTTMPATSPFSRSRPPEASIAGLGRAARTGTNGVTAPRGAFASNGGKGRSGANGTDGSSTPAGVTPGRRPRVSIDDRLVAQSRPSLTLRMTIGAGELEQDGFNTLTVAVVTGTADQRVTESVVFFASAAARIAPVGAFRPPRIGVPTRPTLDTGLLMPALRDVVEAGGGRAATIGPPAAQRAPHRAATLVPGLSPQRRREVRAMQAKMHDRVAARAQAVGVRQEAVKRRALAQMLAPVRDDAPTSPDEPRQKASPMQPDEPVQPTAPKGEREPTRPHGSIKPTRRNEDPS